MEVTRIALIQGVAVESGLHTVVFPNGKPQPKPERILSAAADARRMFLFLGIFEVLLRRICHSD
jgi:hypothetical protein